MPSNDPFEAAADEMVAEQSGSAAPPAPAQTAAADPFEEAADQMATSQSDDRAAVRSLFNMAGQLAPGDHAGIIEASRKLGVSPSVVEADRPRLLKTAQEAGFDEGRWLEQNREFYAELRNRPDLAGVALQERDAPKNVSWLGQQLRALWVYGGYLSDKTAASQMVARQPSHAEKLVQKDPAWNLVRQAAGDAPIDPVAEEKKRIEQGLFVPAGPEPAAPTHEQLYPAPPMVKTTTSPLADAPYLTLDGSRAGMFSEATKKAVAQLDAAQAGVRLFFSQPGTDAWYEHRRTVDDFQAKYGKQVDYKANWAEQVVLDGIDLIGSQGIGWASYAAGASLPKVAAGAAGALLGGIATKSGKGALEGAKLAAGAVSPQTSQRFGQAGSFLGTFALELGTTYPEMADTTTADGLPIDNNTARGFSAGYAAMAALTEAKQVEYDVALLGPLGTAFKAGKGKTAMLELLGKNAAFRRTLTELGEAMGKHSVSESIEEGFQQAQQAMMTWGEKAYTTGRAKGPQAGLAEPMDVGASAVEVGDVMTQTWRGTLVTGLGGSAIGLMRSSAARKAATEAAIANGPRISAIAEVAKDSPLVRAAPDVVARIIEAESKKGGDPIRSLFVDPGAFRRLFQEQGANPDHAATDLLGPDGPRLVTEAIAAGTKLEVPLQAYLETWGKTPAAAALAGDTAVRADAMTLNEATAHEEQVQTETQRLVEQFKASDVPFESDAERLSVQGLEKELLGAQKRGTVEGVKDQVALFRAGLRGLALRAGVPAEAVFQQYAERVRRAEADAVPDTGALQQPGAVERAALPPSYQAVAEAAGKVWGPGDVARRLATDEITGLMSARSVEAMPVDPALPMIAELSWESLKATNDRMGHTAGDDMLRAAAASLMKTPGLVPWAGKVGNAVVFPVRDQAHADEIAKKVRAGLPNTGIRLSAAAAERTSDLRATMDAVGAVHRGIKNQFAGKDRWPQRGERPPRMNKRDWVRAVEQHQKSAKAEHVHPAGVVEGFAGMDPAEAMRTLLVDETGAYTADGWAAIREHGKKNFASSTDMRMLGVLDKKFGRERADEIVRMFTGVVAKLAAEYDIDVAHPHGDEFYAQGNDKVDLEKFWAAVDVVFKKYVFHGTGIEGPKGEGRFKVQNGVHSATGIDADFEVADAKLLPEAKREQDRSGVLRGPAEYADRGAYLADVERARDEGFTVVDLDARVRDYARRVRGALRGGPEGGAAAGHAAQASEAGSVAPQTLLQSKDGTGPRGWVTFVQDGSRRLADIFLTPQQDWSTFLHEQGHVFLDVMGALAQLEDVPASFRQDHATILEWLGARPGETLTRAQEEAFARGFEVYLLEGRAPSIGLKDAFARFSRWLKRIYGSVAALNVNLDDEVRAVFDRMLATDAEIEAAGQKMGLLPLFRSPAEAGMTGPQWQAYLDSQEHATSHAEATGRLAEVREQLRTIKADLKAQEGVVRMKARGEYAALPESRLERYLLKGELVADDGTVVAKEKSRPKLLSAEVEHLVGAEARERLEEKLGKNPWRKAGTEGVTADELASLLGAEDGASMLKALADHVDRDAFVARRVEEARQAGLGALEANRDELQARVLQGLHGDATAAWLVAEWQALRSRNQRGPGGLPAEAIQRAAKEIVDSKAIGSVRPAEALSAERVAANQAARAAAKGDWAQALIHKQAQLLNFYRYRRLTEAAEMRQSLVDLADRMSRDTFRARLGKNGLVFRDAADLILESMGFAEERTRERPLPGFSKALDAFRNNLHSVNFDEEMVEQLVAEQRDWHFLTVAEARQVQGALKQLHKAATSAGLVLVIDKYVTLDEVVSALEREASANLPQRGPEPSSFFAATYSEKAGMALAGVDAELTKMSEMVEWLGGQGVDSTWFKAVMQPLQKAKALDYDLLRAAAGPVLAALEAVPKKVRRRMMDKIPGSKLFPFHKSGISPPSRRFELIMLALNMGNASNKERLLDGRLISEEQVHAALDLLTKEEMDWVQSIWDACESLWPMARDLEERVSGLAPEKIEATPLVTKHGTHRGGYFPAVYDPRSPQWVASTQEGALAAGFIDPTHSRAGTSHSHLKKRADKYAGVLALDPTIFMAHLAQVTHDLAFRESIMSVGRILLNERVQSVLYERLGKERADQFKKWLRDVAQQRAQDVASLSAGNINKLAKFFRGNLAVSTMGYNSRVAIGDLAGNVPTAVVRGLSPHHAAEALAQFAKAPLEVREWALAKSGELRFRMDGVDRELRSLIGGMVAGNPIARNRTWRWYNDHAFTFMEASDAATATPIWLGAYRQDLAASAKAGLSGAESDAHAVAFADNFLRSVLPSYSAVDQVAILRDKSYAGLTVIFYGYFSVYYNMLRHDLHEVWNSPHKGAAAGKVALTVAKVTTGVVARAMATMFVVNVWAEFWSGRGPEPEDGDDDKERYARWLLRKMKLAPLMAFPLVGQFVESYGVKRAPSVRASPAFAALDALGKATWKLAEGKGDEVRAAEEFTRASMMILGIPGTEVAKATSYVLRDDGLREAEDALEDIEKIVYGDRREHQGLSPLRPVTRQ